MNSPHSCDWLFCYQKAILNKTTKSTRPTVHHSYAEILNRGNVPTPNTVVSLVWSGFTQWMHDNNRRSQVWPKGQLSHPWALENVCGGKFIRFFKNEKMGPFAKKNCGPNSGSFFFFEGRFGGPLELICEPSLAVTPSTWGKSWLRHWSQFISSVKFEGRG